MNKRMGSVWVKCLLVVCSAVMPWAAMAKSDSVMALRARYEALGEKLQRNQFGQPLVIESVQAPDRLTGDVYAVVEHPFDEVNAGLNNPEHWCDVISLHINTKYCHAASGPSGTKLRVHIGTKTPEELDRAARVDFDYRVAAATPEYLEIVLNAKDGPMGTSDYRIQFEAIALPNAKTFLHLTYSYGFNFAGRLAMQTYLATLGRDKVGFTPTGKTSDGRGGYVGGMRGLVERNAMRYYLAINSFLESAGSASASRFENRLQSWFTAVEQYPRQLHEMDRAEYVQMKRAENVREHSVN